MDTRRLILFVIFSLSTLMLWDAWQRDHAPVPTEQQADAIPTVNAPTPSANVDTPATVKDSKAFNLAKQQTIQVVTDLLKVEIDTTGGDIRRLELLKHKADNKADGNYVLMTDAANPLLYVAQTGLKGAGLPTHHTVFSASQTSYQLSKGEDKLTVKLTAPVENDISVAKVFTFHRDDYAIDVNYEITNNGQSAISPAVYYQIIHDKDSNQGTMMMPTFTGGAYYTKDKNFQKLSFDDMESEPLSLSTPDGWVGFIQHYFASAWVPKAGLQRKFYSAKLSDDYYSIGSISQLPQIAPGATEVVTAQFFAGPQELAVLKSVTPGLEYTVDYGMLTIIAKPLLWLLTKIHALVHNWGVAIILLTVLIKALFFKLSASSYRSMAKMKEVAPRMQALKEKFGDDRQKMQQAMMEMYQKEKINPLGGCLPMLVQIPVFISLYWVLLGSVELRHAPFFGWIQDLSAQDPYYILPLLMGATMIFQSTLSPAPPDPVQAKVMKIMPVIFSIFFFFFPAGLVLYWLVNNILSIWQQWFVNKKIAEEAGAKKGNGKK